MNFKQALNEIGSFPDGSAMMNPGTSGVAQLVQPKTIQAYDSDQDWNYENAKEKNKKDTKKIDVEKINRKKTEKPKMHYDDEDNEADEKFQEIVSKIDKKIAARAGLIDLNPVSK
jgi:hypothetical protein